MLRATAGGLIGALHAAALLTIVFVESQYGGMVTPLCLGYTCALTSITAIWSVVGQSSFLARRMPLTGVLLACQWMLMMRVVEEPMTSEEGPGWALLVVTQHVVLALFLACIVRLPNLNDRVYRYSLRHMLLFVTLVAVLMGGMRIASSELGWTRDSLAWEYFFFCPVLGVFNAIATFTIAVALVAERLLWKLVLGVFGVALALLAATLCYGTLSFVFGDAGGITRGELALLMATQAAVVWITVFPVWRWPHAVTTCPPA